MPIDAIIRGESSNKKSFREASKYSVKSNLTDSVQNGSEKQCTNYLSKRPATAPSRFHFSTVKGMLLFIYAIQKQRGRYTTFIL